MYFLRGGAFNVGVQSLKNSFYPSFFILFFIGFLMFLKIRFYHKSLFVTENPISNHCINCITLRFNLNNYLS